MFIWVCIPVCAHTRTYVHVGTIKSIWVLRAVVLGIFRMYSMLRRCWGRKSAPHDCIVNTHNHWAISLSSSTDIFNHIAEVENNVMNTHICVYICIYVYVYIPTHTHTHHELWQVTCFRCLEFNRILHAAHLTYISEHCPQPWAVTQKKQVCIMKDCCSNDSI